MSIANRRQHGFTLIELLVVISIIAILAGLLVPAVTLVQRRGRLVECGNNQRQIVTAIIAYEGSEGGRPLATIAGIDLRSAAKTLHTPSVLFPGCLVRRSEMKRSSTFWVVRSTASPSTAHCAKWPSTTMRASP